MRVAIVGCGQISRVHIDALREVEGVELCAVSDRDEFRAREAARLAPGATAYRDFATLLQKERPDAVHVLTPPKTHAELAIQAMDAGCHVLVEKPMALSVQEADQMIAAAGKNGVKLCTNHNYLFKSSVRRARALVESGAIGRVVYVDSYYGLSGESGQYAGAAPGSHWAWRLPGGAFTNFLPHLIYLQLAFLKDVESVAGVATGRGTGSELATELTVLLQGHEASGTMAVSMLAKPYAKWIDIYGTAGIVHADLVREICTVHRERRLPRMVSKALFGLEESLQLASGTAVNTARMGLGKIKPMNDLYALVGEFYSSIRDDHAPPVSGEEGKRMVGVMEMVWGKSPRPSTSEPERPIGLPVGPRSRAEQRVKEHGLPGKVLVTGASGYLGRHLVLALSRAGAHVVALVRDRSKAPWDLERHAELVEGDVRDRASLGRAMRDASIVFHCAAVTTNKERWTTHREINILGTEAVLQEALKAGVRRVVHASSVTVYGFEHDGRTGPISESFPYARNPGRWAYYLRSKLEADRLALQYCRETGLPVTVLRFGILHGPEGRAPSGRGLGQLGPFRLTIGSGQNVLPYTYIDNAVDAALLAAIAPNAAGQAYNIVDEPQITAQEIAAQSAEARGERVVRIPVPPRLLSGIAGLLELRARLTASESPPKLSRFVLQSATRDIKYDSTKARKELGWQPEVRIEEGLERSFARAA